MLERIFLEYLRVVFSGHSYFCNINDLEFKWWIKSSNILPFCCKHRFIVIVEVLFTFSDKPNLHCFSIGNNIFGQIWWPCWHWKKSLSSNLTYWKLFEFEIMLTVTTFFLIALMQYFPKDYPDLRMYHNWDVYQENVASLCVSSYDFPDNYTSHVLSVNSSKFGFTLT